MDDNKKQDQEFDLDEILKEFGTEPDAQLEEPEEVEAEAVLQPEEPQIPQDTVRLDTLLQEAAAEEALPQDTVEFSLPEDTAEFSLPEDTVAFSLSDDTVQFSLPDEFSLPEEAYTPPMPEEDPVEPFSEEWEPEYEQPIGEYVPPQPIIFRPKSRLQELKSKLIAGPEKRYYELAEQGLGKLQVAILVNLLVAVVAIGATFLYGLNYIPEDRTRLMIFLQFLALLLSATIGSYQLMEGVGDLIKRRFSLNTLLVFTFLACLVDGILCLQQKRIPCCGAFSLNMTMSLWGAYHIRNTEMGQMDTMRKATRLNSLVQVPDFYEGRAGILRGEGQVEDFMDNYSQSTEPEKTLSVYAIVALFVSMGIGVTAGVLHGMEQGLQAFAAALLVAVPATTYITLSRPMAILERRLHRLGTVLCGWQGVKALSKDAAFPLSDQDLFPLGHTKVNGVKFYGTRDPDEVVAYAAALMGADGDGTAPLFAQLLDSRNGYHYEAEQLQHYPGGIGGLVNDEPVLMGTLTFMQDMGVDMPEGTRVNQAVYAAIDGQLCGVFAITYTKNKTVTMGLTTLCAYRGLTPVLTTGDFMLTESFLRGKFGVNTRRIAFPARTVRSDLAAVEPAQDLPALALTTGEDLASAAYAVTGARALKLASNTGVAVHLLGGILGLLMMLVLVIVGAEYLLTPMNLLLYELIWVLPGLLITEWTRSV
ncbi:MAG: hypothetical protein IJA45_03760 [Oscillospiraceae bacterium]|nr:hypothetical protein [Oscillospiraceae bacterium]